MSDFKRKLIEYKDMNKDNVMATIRSCLVECDIDYSDISPYEIFVANFNNFMEKRDEYLGKISSMIGEEFHDIFVSYFFDSKDQGLYIRLKYK